MKLPNFSDSPVWVRCVCVCVGPAGVSLPASAWWQYLAAATVEERPLAGTPVRWRWERWREAVLLQNKSSRERKTISGSTWKGWLGDWEPREVEEIFVVSFLVAQSSTARLDGRSIKVMESQCLSVHTGLCVTQWFFFSSKSKNQKSIPGIARHAFLHFSLQSLQTHVGQERPSNYNWR